MKKDITITSAILIGAALIAISIIAGFYVQTKMSSQGEKFVDPDSLFSGREFKKEEYLIGSGNSKVTLLEYSDLECPFCKKLHNETMPQIYNEYSSKVDIVFRHYPLPFHKKAKEEAVASLCAREVGGQKAYLEFIEKVFLKTEGNDSLDLNTLPDIAKDVSLNVDEFKKCLTSASSTAEKMSQVASDLEDGVQAGVQGTPNIFVLIKEGGQYRILTMINGARDYKYVSSVIDQALKQ